MAYKTQMVTFSGEGAMFLQYQYAENASSGVKHAPQTSPAIPRKAVARESGQPLDGGFPLQFRFSEQISLTAMEWRMIYESSDTYNPAGRQCS